MSAARALGLLALAALVAAPAPARAQGTAAPPGVAVVRRPGATLVASTVVIPAGSANDPVALPGAARLTADAVAQTVRRSLDPDAARLEVRVERGWTSFTLLATPDVWTRSWGVLEDVLFRVPLTSAPIESARAALLQGFQFEQGAPMREFQRELYRAIGGGAASWSHDPRGTPESIRGAAAGAVEDFRARSYWMSTATAAVVGPVAEDEARAAVAPIGVTPLPERDLGDDLAWDDGSRTPLPRDVTNSWIGALFPIPAEMPRTQVDFLAYEVSETLNPSPPDPGLFSADVRVEDTPAGPILVVVAAVTPEATALWERRILESMRNLEHEPEPGFFQYRRRRFRNAMLLREGLPEAAALRMALDLLREGHVRPLQDEIWEVGPRQLADAADALGDARVLVLGPELTGDGAGGR